MKDLINLPNLIREIHEWILPACPGEFDIGGKF
jgi:hypothetical protein